MMAFPGGKMRPGFTVALGGLAFIISCFSPQPMIDKVVEPYWDKAYFNEDWQNKTLSSSEWYYRRTVTDTPANTKAASIGDGHWLHPETIRWEVTNKYLIGWRSRASVENAEGEQAAVENGTYKGAPVVMFPITGHFSIVNPLDVGGPDHSNIIEENSEGTFSKHRYFRFDGKKNLVFKTKRQDTVWSGWGSKNLEEETAYMVQENEPSNKNRIHRESDYFDVTSRQGITADIVGYYGGYGEAFAGDSGSPVIDVRHSFSKKENSGYFALHYPDSVLEVDADGNAIDIVSGLESRLSVWDRFGYYRVNFSGRQIWDRFKGSVEKNKNLNITRFDIWEKSKDALGQEIPYKERTPKPIVYYTNVEHPESLHPATQRVAEQWNQAFKETVYYAQEGKYKSLADVPDMFIVRQNSCNVATVTRYLEKLTPRQKENLKAETDVSIKGIESSLAEAFSLLKSDFDLAHRTEVEAKGQLEKLCSALEYYSMNDWLTSGLDIFRYQRPGDLRYNLMNLLTKRALTPWGGLGPMFSDPETGETISATANVNLWYIDRRAQKSANQIEAIKERFWKEEAIAGGKNSLSHMLFLAGASLPSAAEPSNKAIEKLRERALAMHSLGNAVSGQVSRARIQNLEEEGLLPFAVGQQGRLDRQIHNRFFNKSERLRAKSNMKELEPFDSPQFLESMVDEAAIRYQGLPLNERFLKIREETYMAVMLHEIGHNVGLTHNMAASTDALNYGSKFWQLNALPKDIGKALRQIDDVDMIAELKDCRKRADELKRKTLHLGVAFDITTQDCLGQSETMYSSIMDYHGGWNTDLNGLGSYDKAALKFGYAQLLEVFPEESLKLDVSRHSVKQFLETDSWKSIPTRLFKSVEGIETRNHIKISWSKEALANQVPSNHVPYAFCMSGAGYPAPSCKTFDFGPDAQSRVQKIKDRYWKNYVFTHFANGEIWSDDDVLRRLNSDVNGLSDINEIMQWYAHLVKTKPGFVGSEKEKDYVIAVAMGLNHYAHIIGQADAGVHSLSTTEDLSNYMTLSPLQDRNSATVMYTPGAGGLLKTVFVPLGEGRPLHTKYAYGEGSATPVYLGTEHVKRAAIMLLASQGDFGFRETHLNQFEPASFYGLFPEEVGGLYAKLISGDLASIGPRVLENGKVLHRNLVDIETLNSLKTSSLEGEVLPQLAPQTSLIAAAYAGAFFPSYVGDSENFLKSMTIAVRGGENDSTLFNILAQDQIMTFIHPEGEVTLRAPKYGAHHVGFKVLTNLELQKQRYVLLRACLANEGDRASTVFCNCMNGEKAGTQNCSLDTLEKRLRGEEKKMDELTIFAGKIQKLTSVIGNN